MKPLVLWCRWHEATIRLHGRSADAVWGELAFPGRTAQFHYDLHNHTLTINEGDVQKTIRLDEMGVEITEDD